MAETITVKSPSLFLTPSETTRPHTPVTPLRKEPLEPAATHPNPAVKRKQTKSRNGASFHCSYVPRVLMGPALPRLHNMQGEAPQVRRDEANMSPVRQTQRQVRRLQEGLQVAPL